VGIFIYYICVWHMSVFEYHSYMHLTSLDEEIEGIWIYIGNLSRSNTMNREEPSFTNTAVD